MQTFFLGLTKYIRLRSGTHTWLLILVALAQFCAVNNYIVYPYNSFLSDKLKYIFKTDQSDYGM